MPFKTHQKLRHESILVNTEVPTHSSHNSKGQSIEQQQQQVLKTTLKQVTQ